MSNQEIEEKLIALLKPRMKSSTAISNSMPIEVLIPDSLARVELQIAIEEAFEMNAHDDFFYHSRSSVGEVIDYIQLLKNDPVQFEIQRQAFLQSVEEQRKRKTIWAGVIFILYILILNYVLWKFL